MVSFGSASAIEVEAQKRNPLNAAIPRRRRGVEYQPIRVALLE
jgi:hypothetical protein